MLFVWLWSCFFVTFCSAKCKQENIIFTGDDKSFWVAEIEGESTPQVLAPKKTAIFVDRDKGEIKVTVRPTCGAVKLLAVSLETKNFQNIDVLEKTKTLPSGNFQWLKSSFKFKEKLVEKITIRVKTDDFEAALQSIYVKACVVDDPKTLKEEMKEVLLDIQQEWKSENMEKILELYYTDDVIQVVQGVGVKKGKDNIEILLQKMIPDRDFGVRRIIDSGQLSETRAYTVLEARFYTDETMSKILKPVYALLILWKKEGNRWKIDKFALTDDGSLCS